MDRMPDKIDSKFRFVLLASERAEQLMRGASARIDDPNARKPSRIAMEEIIGDVIDWEYGQRPVDADPDDDIPVAAPPAEDA